MLCYKKFFKTFEPTFYITANEKIIDQGQSAQIPITNNTIKISYNYSFINGYKKGAQQIIFTIPSERKTLNLGFSWSNKWRITTSSATPIKAQKLPYEEREQRSLLLTK
jgi:hypothetical protein